MIYLPVLAAGRGLSARGVRRPTRRSALRTARQPDRPPRPSYDKRVEGLTHGIAYQIHCQFYVNALSDRRMIGPATVGQRPAHHPHPGVAACPLVGSLIVGRRSAGLVARIRTASVDVDRYSPGRARRGQASGATSRKEKPRQSRRRAGSNVVSVIVRPNRAQPWLDRTVTGLALLVIVQLCTTPVGQCRHNAKAPPPTTYVV